MMGLIEEGNVIYGVFDQTKQPSELTLSDLMEDWNIHVNKVQNSKTTWTFNSNIQKHILSFFGLQFPLGEMTPKKVMEYFAFLKTEKKFCNNTINKHRTHLLTLFEYMIENEETYGLQINPVRRVKPLKSEPIAHRIYEPNEAKKILRAIHESGQISLEAAVGIALYCGCRREEVCALRWENVDMENRIMTICETCTTAGKEVVWRSCTKNNTIRQIGIPNELIKILRRVQRQQKRNRENGGNLYHDELDYVVSEPDGMPWHPNNVTKRWSRFVKEGGFRYIRFHDLRHTNLSLLMRKMSAVDVAKLGGHKRVSTTTNIYGHSFNDALKKGIDAMNELL